MLTDQQVKEFDQILGSIKGHAEILKDLAAMGPQGLAALRALPELLKTEQKRNDELASELKSLKKRAMAGAVGTGVRWVNGVPFVSDEAARALSATFCIEAERLGALKNVIRDESARQNILQLAAGFVGVELKTALDSTTTPLPTIYMPQVIELVWAYGQARQYATVYPLGATTVKLPRLKAGEDDFSFLGTGTGSFSQTVSERRVTAELITFTASKVGGIIRIPTEIEQDTFIPLGQFLARYIARQLAKIEDKALFLGDGTATYGSITGVGPYCAANNAYLVQLAAGKTKVSDATIADFRNLRTKVNAAVLVDSPAYYLHPSLEALLVTFNTINNPLIYQRANGSSPATLDGFPIHWVGVMQPYSTVAAAGTDPAFFGALSYWYLGERGAPRVEMSREVYFATDELAMRALERIDIESMAVDAMSALQTAAA